MIFEGARDDEIVYPRSPRRRWLWLAELLFALNACATDQQVTLSDPARVACAGQTAANAATVSAGQLGKADVAAASAAVSAGLGMLCKW